MQYSSSTPSATSLRWSYEGERSTFLDLSAASSSFSVKSISNLTSKIVSSSSSLFHSSPHSSTISSPCCSRSSSSQFLALLNDRFALIRFDDANGLLRYRSFRSLDRAVRAKSATQLELGSSLSSSTLSSSSSSSSGSSTIESNQIETIVEHVIPYAEITQITIDKGNNLLTFCTSNDTDEYRLKMADRGDLARCKAKLIAGRPNRKSFVDGLRKSYAISNFDSFVGKHDLIKEKEEDCGGENDDYHRYRVSTQEDKFESSIITTSESLSSDCSAQLFERCKQSGAIGEDESLIEFRFGPLSSGMRQNQHLQKQQQQQQKPKSKSKSKSKSNIAPTLISSMLRGILRQKRKSYQLKRFGDMNLSINQPNDSFASYLDPKQETEVHSNSGNCRILSFNSLSDKID